MRNEMTKARTIIMNNITTNVHVHVTPASPTCEVEQTEWNYPHDQIVGE